MKAILLCAGYGKRLRPITNKIPKCLVKIHNKTLLEIWLDKIANLGINDVLINTHYLPTIINDFISNINYKNMKINLSYEENLLGTAGTVIKNINFFNNEECLLIHSDNYCEDSLFDFLTSHKKRKKECLLSMLTFKTNDPKNCGIVKIDDNYILRKFEEKPLNPTGDLANGAVYILSSEFLNILKDKEYSDFSVDVIPRFVNKINCYKTKHYFIDIGNPKSYDKVCKRVTNLSAS